MFLTRRTFGKVALAVPAASIVGKGTSKPDSKVGGVQIGLNVPYSFHGMSGTADDILADMLQLGISAAELRLQPVEAFLGAPGVVTQAAVVPGAPAAPRNRAPLTPEQQAEKVRVADELRKWRLALSMDKIKGFRKKYEDAGVLIQIVKYDGISDFTDDEIDYCFTVARTLGARAISCEIPLSRTKRLGSFADKHKMMVGYHGHTDIHSPEAFGRPESWETAMSYAKYNGINLDLGHFTAGNSTSPVPFITKYHDRITHVHVKDKKLNNGPNMPFGQGDTPVVEVLQLMKKEKWKFQATIEFEYPVPPGSDVMTEIGKCVEYCRKALA
jgi:hypothetical protein